jgi:hypothetical protein
VAKFLEESERKMDELLGDSTEAESTKDEPEEMV